MLPVALASPAVRAHIARCEEAVRIYDYTSPLVPVDATGLDDLDTS